MAQIFGRRWFTDFGESPPPVWVKAMEGLTEAHVRQGLSVMERRDNNGFLPVLGQFLAACYQGGPVRNTFVPPPVIDDDVARVNLTLWNWLVNRAMAEKQPVPADLIPALVREKNRIAATTAGATKAEYDEMRPGIMRQFNAVIEGRA